MSYWADDRGKHQTVPLTFTVMVEVSTEFLRKAPLARALIREALVDKAHEELRGPRGGRYRPINEPYDFRDDATAIHGIHAFAASVDVRYVRPSRRPAVPGRIEAFRE